MNILNRNSTSINIATFWENYQLGKYNFDPVYQRRGDVWSESKQSFLIDTILKNFPIPPIFLHQHIDEETGKTMYDIIDGKQRLSAVIAFINNQIKIPEDFNSDNFGDEKLAGIYFKDFEALEMSEWKKVFWRYDITIEYIDTDQTEIVNNIFDRLNRNGEPLTKQELRNAKFNTTELYQLIRRLSENQVFTPVFNKIQTNRLEHEEFIFELLLSLVKQDIVAGDSPTLIDSEYENLSKNQVFNDDISQLEECFNQITNLINDFHLDIEGYKIQGISHFYALWTFAMIISLNNLDFNSVPQKLNEFYTNLKNNDLDDNLKDYKISMSAGTKSRNRRVRRVNSLLQFCGFEYRVS